MHSSAPVTPGAGRVIGDFGPSLPLRERVLDCTMKLSAELPGLSIDVGDLLEMRPGTVINLHEPVETPVQLRTGDYPLFEVTPVRRNGHKTAQLGQPFNPFSGASL